jgi:zinc protease
VLSLPGSWETTNAVGGAIEEMVRFELPADYWSRYPAELAALDRAGVQSAAGELVRPGHLVWLVVGDRAKIEQQIRDVGFAEIRALDADGQPLAE